MAKQKHSEAYVNALWNGYKRRCLYCEEPIRRYEVEIDHILPESLDGDPEELAKARAECGLDDTFSILGRLNHAPSCRRCNRDKGARTYPPGRIMIILQRRKELEPTIQALEARYAREKAADNLWAQMSSAIEKGDLPPEAVKAISPDDEAGDDGVLGSDDQPAPEIDPEVLRLLGNASDALLGWPAEIRGVWLQRPELEQLHASLGQESHSFTALLGEPGSGKSALLARLGNDLRRTDTVLLALKADLIRADIAKLTDLQDFLGLQRPLAHCIADISRSRRVVLLVDQLDALGDLMDQRTGRMTVILSLFNQLRRIEGVHIIFSCRSFEYEHHLRLSSLGPSKVELSPPSWDEVDTILKRHGVDAGAWPHDARELLRRPQHLSLFVRHFAASDQPRVFTSYQRMLESVIERCVDSESGPELNAALNKVADFVAGHEELWIPKIRIDEDYPLAVKKLLASDLLFCPEQGRIGFRHQTVFEFVRARAFAAQPDGLAAHVFAKQQSLFVRPALWGTLHYLRGLDRQGYLRELGRLWDDGSLKPHIRQLLIAFLGSQTDPLPKEAVYFKKALENEAWRNWAFDELRKNPAWFPRARPTLAGLMARNRALAGLVAWAFMEVAKTHRDEVLSLIESYWAPKPEWDPYILHALCDLEDWDERSVSVVERSVRRTRLQNVVIRMVADKVAKSAPSLAARVVAAELWGELQRIESEAVAKEPPPGDDAETDDIVSYMRRKKPHDEIERFVSDTRWHGMGKVVRADPEAFAGNVWPWLLKVAARHAKAPRNDVQRYRDDPVFRMSNEQNYNDQTLVAALELALSEFAKATPQDFSFFVAERSESDLLIVHRLLAQALTGIASSHPALALDYVLGDDRRLSLGARVSHHTQSIDLIRTLAPHATAIDLARLEERILSSAFYLPTADRSPEERQEHLTWNREHRLRLLRAIPGDRLSQEAKRIVDEETRRFQSELAESPPDKPMIVQTVGSPMSPEQMSKASDDHLIKLFDDIAAGPRAWRDRKGRIAGGVTEASRAFGELASRDPQRVVRLLSRLDHVRHELYAAEALGKLLTTDGLPASDVVQLVHDLTARGFCSTEFRWHVAHGLADLAKRQGGLDDPTCELLESWLEPHQANSIDAEPETDPDKHESVLLYGGGALLPHGNYPPLNALYLGLMLRKPDEPDRWLAVLERHVNTPEDPAVWGMLAYDGLQVLRRADEKRTVALISKLIEPDRGVFRERGFATLMARAQWWLPSAVLDAYLDVCLAYPSPRMALVASELATWIHCIGNGTDKSNKLVQSVIEGGIADKERLTAMRRGAAFLAGHAWESPKFRKAATDVLVALARNTDDDLAEAWHSVFRADHAYVDEHLSRLVEAVAESEPLLRYAHIRYFVDALRDGLAAEVVEAPLVCKAVLAMLDAAGDQIGDLQAAWSGFAEDFINIALTLQRIEETRAGGLEIFERLMSAGAYGVKGVLHDIDRRVPN